MTRICVDGIEEEGQKHRYTLETLWIQFQATSQASVAIKCVILFPVEGLAFDL